MASNPNPWILAGPASSFPDLSPTSDSDSTSQPTASLRPSTPNTTSLPPCQILQLDPTAPIGRHILTPSEAQSSLESTPQALVFRYRGRVHAIDHACPHRTFALSRGGVHDIEDFGVVLSAGITCPGHGWMFDLFTGEADRGAYRLGVWDVEVRGEGEEEEEVWVRRREGLKKRRIG